MSPRKSILRATLALALAAMSSDMASAGVGRWTAYGPGGGLILDLGLGPLAEGGTALYARAEHGIFRSVDGGVSWQWQSLPFYGPLAVGADAPGVLYTVDNYVDKAYRSSNGGAAWTAAGPIPTDFGLLRAADGVLYGGGAARVPGISMSRDGGASWRFDGLEGEVVSSIAIDPVQPLVGYAGTPKGIWKTVDDGQRWYQLLAMPPGAVGPGFVAVSPAEPGRVFFAAGDRVYSAAGESFWQLAGRLAEGGEASGLAVDEAGTLYATVRGGLQISDDLGASWRQTLDVPPVFEGSDLLAPVVDPTRPGVVYAATLNHGLYVSRDRGETWTSSVRAGLGFPFTQVLKTDPRDGAVYLIRLTWADRLLRSRDRGRTWSVLAEPSGLPFNVRDVAFDLGASARPGSLYAAGDRLYRSHDGGDTWTSLQTPEGVPVFEQILARGRQLVVASVRGVHRSADAGATWAQTLAGPERGIDRLVQDPFDAATLYALSDPDPLTGTSLVYRSRNGGVSWRQVQEDVHAFTPDPQRRGRLYAAKGPTLMYSRDRGETWESIGRIPARLWALAADTSRPGLLLAGTHDVQGVMVSRNGGRSWEPYNVGLAKLRLTFASQIVDDPLTPGGFFVLPEGGGVFESVVP